jgi:hypothetical protein
MSLPPAVGSGWLGKRPPASPASGGATARAAGQGGRLYQPASVSLAPRIARIWCDVGLYVAFMYENHKAVPGTFVPGPATTKWISRGEISTGTLPPGLNASRSTMATRDNANGRPPAIATRKR